MDACPAVQNFNNIPAVSLCTSSCPSPAPLDYSDEIGGWYEAVDRKVQGEMTIHSIGPAPPGELAPFMHGMKGLKNVLFLFLIPV